MSARDAESGSSTYKGGSRSAGGIGNGGVGGGMGGGGNWGVGGTNRGGAARNGGYAAGTTGLTTGTVMRGVAGPNGFTAVGRPGGMAMNPGAWGVRPQDVITRAPMNRPTVPGLLGPAAPVPAGYPELVIEDVPMPPVAPNIPRTYVPSPSTLHPAPYPPAPSAYDPYRYLNQPRPTGGPYRPADMSNMPSYGSSVGKAPGVDPHDLAARDWSGSRVNIGAIGGGQGVPGYSSGGAPGYGGRRY